MKDSLKNLDLWQQKRNELPIDTEPQAGWAEMQSILDKHLPVLPVAQAAQASKIAKVLKALKAVKLSTVLLVSLSVATVAGLTVYIVKNQLYRPNHPHKKHNRPIGKDSLQYKDTGFVNSLNITDTTGNLQDSLSSFQSPSVNVYDTTFKNKEAAAIKNGSNTVSAIASVVNHNKSRTGTIPMGLNAINNSLTTNNLNKNGKILNSGGLNSRNGASGINLTQRYNKQVNKSASTLNQTGGKSSSNGLLFVGDSSIGNQANAEYDQSLAMQAANDISMFTPSINTAQSWQPDTATGGGGFTRPNFFANQPLAKFTVSWPIASAKAGRGDKNSAVKHKQITGSSNGSSKGKRSKSGSGRSLSTFFNNFDWGILIGANSSGSFTPGAQNSNIYGSFPIDMYTGAFGTLHLGDKWAINTQVRLLTPLNFSGSYSNKNFSNVDSAQYVKVTDSRKAYFVGIPVHVVYKVNNNISIKGGPVINIPVKQVNSSTSLQSLNINVDTVYYASTLNKIKATQYDQKINLGLSGGVSMQFNRLIFETLYQKSLSGYKVASDFGSYKNNPGSVQITVGFKLNGLKHH